MIKMPAFTCIYPKIDRIINKAEINVQASNKVYFLELSTKEANIGWIIAEEMLPIDIMIPVTAVENPKLINKYEPYPQNTPITT